LKPWRGCGRPDPPVMAPDESMSWIEADFAQNGSDMLAHLPTCDPSRCTIVSQHVV
jgi:hypothetical protein